MGVPSGTAEPQILVIYVSSEASSPYQHIYFEDDMARNVQTEEAIRAVLRGDTDNLLLFGRDALIGAAGALLARGIDAAASLGLPPDLTLYGGFVVALLGWRELRDRGYLKRFGIRPKVVVK